MTPRRYSGLTREIHADNSIPKEAVEVDRFRAPKHEARIDVADDVAVTVSVGCDGGGGDGAYVLGCHVAGKVAGHDVPVDPGRDH